MRQANNFMIDDQWDSSAHPLGGLRDKGGFVLSLGHKNKVRFGLDRAYHMSQISHFLALALSPVVPTGVGSVIEELGFSNARLMSDELKKGGLRRKPCP